MLTPSDFGDGVTVIRRGGPTPLAIPKYMHPQPYVATGRNSGNGAELSSVIESHSISPKISDYFSEERPFVVLIGKKGVIGALQELDQILRTVCIITGSRFSVALLCYEPF
jgi:hypothetical protein